MAQTRSALAAQRPIWSLLWLVLATILLFFSNGRPAIPIAAWLGPLFLVRFLRSQRPLPGLLIGYFISAAAFHFQFRGMVPIPGIGYYGFVAMTGFVVLLPYLIDRLVAPRLGGFLATLVLPMAWASTEYLVSAFAPYGSWGSVAYSQYGNLPLLQILSVTGLFGVTFLIGWFASVWNWIWEHDIAWHKVRVGALTYGSILMLVLLLGGARLMLFPPASATVRVASISKPDLQGFPTAEIQRRLFAGEATSADLEAIRSRGQAIADDLLARADREARAGAKVVFWGEANAPVFREDEAALIDRGRQLARERQIYLAMALATWNRGQARPLENKVVLLDASGNLAWEFYKARSVPGEEAAISALGDGRIKSLATPYGRIAAAICFDMDFPQLLRQAGQLGADVLLAPSNDWREIDPWHTQMATFRAIEQGFSLVRHTSRGLSAGVDYQGRVLAAMDHYQATDRAMISQVPIQGVRTIYSRVGDLFAWLCLLGILAMVGWVLSRGLLTKESP